MLFLVLGVVYAAPTTLVDPRLVVSDPPVVAVEPGVSVDPAVFAAVEMGALGTVMPVPSDYGGWTVSFEGMRRFRGVPCRDRVSADYSGTWSCAISESWTSGGFRVEAGEVVSFHLGTAHLAHVEDHGAITVAGVPCAGWFSLSEDGTFSSCALALPVAFPGTVQIPAGAEVNLYEGVLWQATFTEGPTLGGRSYADVPLDPCGTFVVTFARDGSITSAGPGMCC